MRQHGQARFQRPFRIKMPEANGICADRREEPDVMAARHLMRRGDIPFAVVTHGDDISADRTDKKADAAQIAAGGLRLIERAGPVPI